MGDVKSKVAHDIVSYLERNPDASDTTEGIARWWLLDAYPVHEVRAALAELIAAGMMLARRGENSHIHYRKGGDAG